MDTLNAYITPDFSKLPDIQKYYDKFMSHPQLDKALREYFTSALGGFSQHPQISKIVSTEARALAWYSILARYADKRARCDIDGLMITEVQRAALEGAPFVSRNRVNGLIHVFEYAGYGYIIPSEKDARQKLFVINEAGWNIVGIFWKAIVRAVESLQDTDIVSKVEGSPAYMAAFFRTLVSQFVRAGYSRDIFPGYDSVLNATSGPETIVRLYLTASESPGKDIIMPISHLARQKGVSRAQMRRIMADCENLGLIKTSGTGGRDVTVLPALNELCEKFVVVRLALVAYSADLLSENALCTVRN